MPHQRNRHVTQLVRKHASFWPVVGVLGLRHVGKTTLLRDLLGIKTYASFDDEEVQDEAKNSSKNFLAKLTPPVVIDEAQKVASLFDAIKLKVDHKRIPGQYFLTGSSKFSSKLGIRESLTGRIGLVHLFPFTLAEAEKLKSEFKRARLLHEIQPRFKVESALHNLSIGGLPVPLFTRDIEQRENYFKNWIETAVIRDIARVFGRGYDPDVSWSLLRQFSVILREGELPSLRGFKQDARVLRKYLSAFEDIFLIRKIPCHESGVGDDVWVFEDCGIASHIMGTQFGEGATLSAARSFVLKEILAAFEYAGKSIHPTYYKSIHGSPVDLVGSDAVIKITTAAKSGTLSYEERALAGAMKKLKIKTGFLVAPVDRFEKPKPGINVVPWTYWS